MRGVRGAKSSRKMRWERLRDETCTEHYDYQMGILRFVDSIHPSSTRLAATFYDSIFTN